MPHGPYIGLELKTGMPMNKPFSEVFSQGVGGAASVGVQVGDNSFVDFTGEVMTHGKKSTIKDENFKPKNLLSLSTGFRYNFWQNSEMGFWYVHPRFGLMQVGKDINTLVFTPMAGYSIKGKLNFYLYFQQTTSSAPFAKLSTLGLGTSFNIFTSGSGD